LQRSQGERNRQRKISRKKYQKHEDRGRHIERGSYYFTMMSKGDKDKYQKKKIKSMKIGGAAPKGDTLFH
jgi:hypothetical protein